MSQGKSETTDIVQELRERVIGHPALMDRAATVIERLRAQFLRECGDIGYSDEEAREMLAEIENGH